MQCATHPSVETELACGRCEKPICPRCLVYTPVGARCRDCAQVKALPQFNVTPQYYARAIVAALVTGAGLGVAWGLLLTTFLGFFDILIGIGIGYVVGEGVSLAANRKQGPPLQIIAGVGVVVAYLLRNVLWEGSLIVQNDIYGYIAVAVGVAVAVGRLR
jgi:hypothetical protein